MSISARLARGLTRTAERMYGPVAPYASDEEAILESLKILESRTFFGDALFEAWRGRLLAQLTGLHDRADVGGAAPDLRAAMASLRERIATTPVTREAGEAMQRQAMREWAELVERLTGDPRIDARVRLSIVHDSADAELARIREMCGGLLPSTEERDTAITAARLQAYLADRFDDADLRVTEFRPLPGGYGKETILFSVAGTAFSGDFVMRRDRDAPALDNDCHRVSAEYPVIRAAFDNGFPAPEALWVDTEHALLPGGDFLIMVRAAGSSGGNVHGAAEQVDPALAQLLAGCVARLHQLPPMRELGDLTEGIATELWDLPPDEVTRRYIQSFRDLYVAQMVTPSPAVLALYGWLLANVPRAQGRTVLLHGDIGFHNFVIDDGRLTAVVDWEFAHLGDPADDLGYVRNTAGGSLDWDAFMAAYHAAGGPEVDAARLRFFRIWGHVRNLTASQMITNLFETGQLDELKLGHVGHSMMAGFLAAIEAILDEDA
ncbi:MAG: hypothetical protein RIS94_197 [Pseudomonadota bacterium]|jgi:aminoglycoside phosphotransferase (APT) family kinase protein